MNITLLDVLFIWLLSSKFLEKKILAIILSFLLSLFLWRMRAISKKKKNVILKLPFGRGFTLSVHLLFIISVNTCQASSFTVLGWKKRSKTNSYSLSLPSDLCIFLISRTTWQNTYLNLIFTDDKKIWEGKNMLHIHITRTTDRGRTNQPLPLSD